MEQGLILGEILHLKEIGKGKESKTDTRKYFCVRWERRRDMK